MNRLSKKSIVKFTAIAAVVGLFAMLVHTSFHSGSHSLFHSNDHGTELPVENSDDCLVCVLSSAFSADFTADTSITPPIAESTFWKTATPTFEDKDEHYFRLRAPPTTFI